MKLTNKLPRTLSIVAAILMLLTLIGGFIGSIGNWVSMFSSGNTATAVTSIVTFLFNSLAVVLCIVVLFLGKRNSIGGILLILSALITAGLRVIGSINAIVSYFAMKDLIGNMFGPLVGSNLCGMVGGLVTAVFYILLAIECFAPGKFSTSKAKFILFILPVLIAILSVLSSIMLQLPTLKVDLVAFVATSIGSLLGNLISHVPVLLMGIAFATPVYEQDPYAGYPAPPYTNV